MGNYRVDILVLASTYVGCFADNWDNHTIQERTWKDQTDITVEFCLTNCAWVNYQYYGLLEHEGKCESTLPSLPRYISNVIGER